MSRDYITQHPLTSGRSIPVACPVAVHLDGLREPRRGPYVAAQGPNRDGTTAVPKAVPPIPDEGTTLASPGGGSR
jgi:hypothetical protein